MNPIYSKYKGIGKPRVVISRGSRCSKHLGRIAVRKRKACNRQEMKMGYICSYGERFCARGSESLTTMMYLGFNTRFTIAPGARIGMGAADPPSSLIHIIACTYTSALRRASAIAASRAQVEWAGVASGLRSALISSVDISRASAASCGLDH